ncbi:GNAT family N-acetyltransferase [Flavobacterium sinopsychrotolerans]|uniref:Acetyltransferase (GNAT) domain-containing protein n=1 Tax=Flavobacterium sinopsychrotolerans TaxID=604089 RepID=A0A1H8R8Y0_9FLAO|nr:GNAT family N-acetyltransferase [Flavobacterium sinopsychrotolerans]SEO62832.1 Acetyltransferase (GNAT) domain-containing protein [Flavobacterium sinopsychrotolerans]
MNNYLETFTVDNSIFGVKLMDNENEEEIKIFFTLFNECFGERAHLDKEWYNWYYSSNPKGECNNYLLFDVNNAILVGAYGFAKIQYTINLKSNTGVLGVNGMISKKYGRRGLFSKLMTIALNYETKTNLAFSFPHGFNLSSVKGHINCGWSLNENFHFYELISKTPIAKNKKIKILTIDDLSKIEFGLFNKESNFYFNRDKDFIKWRFFERPSKEYIIVGNFVSDQLINGYMILGRYLNKDQKIITQIVDYRVENAEVLENLIKTALVNGAIINLLISEVSENLRIFKKIGFEKKEECYKLMTYPDTIDNMYFEGLLGDFDVV